MKDNTYKPDPQHQTFEIRGSHIPVGMSDLQSLSGISSINMAHETRMKLTQQHWRKSSVGNLQPTHGHIVNVRSSNDTSTAGRIKQFKLARGDPLEPCIQCVTKRIRSGATPSSPVQYRQYGPIPKQGFKIQQSQQPYREELKPNIIALETKEDYLNNQRCLYFDKTIDENDKLLDLILNVTQIQSIQKMKNQLDQTELGLEAFADAQKFTVDEMIKQPPLISNGTCINGVALENLAQTYTSGTINNEDLQRRTQTKLKIVEGDGTANQSILELDGGKARQSSALMRDSQLNKEGVTSPQDQTKLLSALSPDLQMTSEDNKNPSMPAVTRVVLQSNMNNGIANNRKSAPSELEDQKSESNASKRRASIDSVDQPLILQSRNEAIMFGKSGQQASLDERLDARLSHREEDEGHEDETELRPVKKPRQLTAVTKIKKSGQLNLEGNQQEAETPGLQVHTLTNNSQTAYISPNQRKTVAANNNFKATEIQPAAQQTEKWFKAGDQSPDAELQDAQPFVHLQNKPKEQTDDVDELTLAPKDAQSKEINNDKLDVELQPLLLGEQDVSQLENDQKQPSDIGENIYNQNLQKVHIEHLKKTQSFDIQGFIHQIQRGPQKPVIAPNLSQRGELEGRTQNVKRQSRFYSAKLPLNLKAGKASFVFKHSQQASLQQPKSNQGGETTVSGVQQSSQPILDGQQDVDISPQKMPRHKNLRLSVVQIQMNSNFDKMLRNKSQGRIALAANSTRQKFAPIPEQPPAATEIDADYQEANQATMMYLNQQSGKQLLVDNSRNQDTQKKVQVKAGLTSHSVSPTASSQDTARQKLSLPAQGSDKKINFYQEQKILHVQTDFELSQKTQSQLSQDRQTSPFFKESQRRNLLHNYVNKHKLEQAKSDAGMKSKFFKRSTTKSMNAFNKASQQAQFKTHNPSAKNSIRVRKVDRQVGPGYKKISKLLQTQNMPSRSAMVHTANSTQGPRRVKFVEKTSTKKAQLMQKVENQAIQIPHPNSKSNFYDKLFNQGPYDPMTNTHKLNTNVQNYTYRNWVDDKLSPNSAKKLKNNQINKVPQYKVQTLMSQTSRRRLASNYDGQSGSLTLLENKKEMQEEAKKELLRPRRSALPRFKCATQYNLTEFLNQMDEEADDECMWGGKEEKERVLCKIDSLEQLTKMFIKQKEEHLKTKIQIEAGREFSQIINFKSLPAEIQRKHKRDKEYQELQKKRQEQKDIEIVRAKYYPKKEYIDRYNRDLEQIRVDYPNYVPNKDKQDSPRGHGSNYNRKSSMPKENQTNDQSAVQPLSSDAVTNGAGMIGSGISSPGPASITSSQHFRRGNTQNTVSRFKTQLNRRTNEKDKQEKEKGKAVDYVPKREGHNFYKQQQLALLVPGFVDFILQGNSNFGGGGAQQTDAAKLNQTLGGFHSHTVEGKKKDNVKLEKEIDQLCDVEPKIQAGARNNILSDQM